MKKLIAITGIAAISLSTLSPAQASTTIGWDGTETVTMNDTLNATMFERAVSYELAEGDAASFVMGTTTVLELDQNDEYFYRISANSESNNVDKGSIQGLTQLTPAEQETYYQDVNYFDFAANSYEWSWVMFACVDNGAVVSAPTLSLDDVRPSFTSGYEVDDYDDFWANNPQSNTELLVTSQYIRDAGLTTANGFADGSSIDFLQFANGSDSLALRYSEQRITGSACASGSPEALEIQQSSTKVSSRSLDLSAGIELSNGSSVTAPEDFEGYSIAVYGTAAISPTNAVSHFGLTTLGVTPTETAPSPTPYVGPLIQNINNTTGPYETFSGEQITVYGERLSSINKVFINNLEGEVVSTSDDHFVMITPEGLTAGSYDLVVESSIGNLRFLDAFVVREQGSNEETALGSCEGVEASWWTKRISDTQAKAYIKCPEVGQKYRILQQTGGNGSYDSIFAKTLADENDPAQVFNEVGRYIVRTIELENINRLRITAGEQELWKVRYNR